MKVDIQHEGSFVLFTPLDATAREWFEENVSSEPWQWLGASLAVDHRMAGDLILAMESAPVPPRPPRRNRRADGRAVRRSLRR